MREEDVVLQERFHGGVLGRHLHFDGVLKRSSLKLCHFARHGGREEESGSVARDCFDDLVDFHLEIHAQHFVSLI